MVEKNRTTPSACTRGSVCIINRQTKRTCVTYNVRTVTQKKGLLSNFFRLCRKYAKPDRVRLLGNAKVSGRYCYLWKDSSRNSKLPIRPSFKGGILVMRCSPISKHPISEPNGKELNRMDWDSDVKMSFLLLDTKTHVFVQFLSRVCKNGHISLLKTIHKSMENIECRPKRAAVSSMLATSTFTEYLIKNNCNSSYPNGNTILHLAVLYNDIDSVSLILSHNFVDKDAIDHTGHTPAMLATRLKDSDILPYLIAKGCDTHKVNREGQNILHLALKFQRVDNIKLILSRDLVDKEVKDSSGKSAIMVAASGGYYRAFKALLDHGCSVEGEDGKGNTIVQLACRGRSRFIVQELLKTVDVELLKKRNNLGKRPDCLDERNKFVSRKSKMPRIS